MEKITFQELKIQADVLKAINEMGFTHPTEIQEKAIPMLSLTNKDFIGQAQTGTGKTAAFVIPLLEKIDYENVNVQALILTPTRELAFQVESEIGKLGKHTDVRSTCIYGGTSYEKQIRSLRRDKPQIVVGTPGRVIDLINKGILKLDEASFCVLDEADEMLNMGFFEDVQTVLDIFKEERQLIMFSATMPQAILRLIGKSFNEYNLVKVKNKSLSNDDIDQKYFIVKDRHFQEALARIIDNAEDMYGIVFCRTKVETNQVGNDLKKRGYSVEVLNGDMGQAERDHAMRNFKERKVNIMVCTDVAARGIDVNCLTHVFNYGLPQDNESYVHRIGRTGRAGMKGKAYTIVGPRSSFAMRKIEKHINKKIELGKLPSITELKEKVVEKEMESGQQILDAIQTKGETFKVDNSFKNFKAQFGNLESEELLKFMFTWKFNKALRHYNSLSDIEESPGGSNSRGSRDGGQRSRGGRGHRGGSNNRGSFRRRDDSRRDVSEGNRGRRDGGRSRAEGGRTRAEGNRARTEGGRTRADGNRARTEAPRGNSERRPARYR